jgi:hypothetical protein
VVDTVNLASFSIRVILSEAAQRAESPSKKNATTIDLYDLRLLAILTTMVTHDPDDVLRIHVGFQMFLS